jgi:hypothetical protein
MLGTDLADENQGEWRGVLIQQAVVFVFVRARCLRRRGKRDADSRGKFEGYQNIVTDRKEMGE